MLKIAYAKEQSLSFTFLFLFASCGEMVDIDLFDKNANASSTETKAPFVSKWKVPLDNTSINTNEEYHFFIDWGDGTPEVLVDDPSELVHLYSVAGEYIITIKGKISRINSDSFGVSSKTMLIAVIDLGDMGWTKLDGAFSDCKKLVSFSGGIVDQVTTMEGMFGGTSSLVSLETSSWDTSKVLIVLCRFLI